VIGACAGFGAALFCFAMSRSFWLSAALLVPAGFAMMVQMAGSNTLVQAMVPDALRGRVMSVYSMMFMGLAPVGALLAGWLAHRFGAPATVAAGGVCCVIGAAAFATRLPRLRGEARQLIIAQHSIIDGRHPARVRAAARPPGAGDRENRARRLKAGAARACVARMWSHGRSRGGRLGPA